VSANKHSSEQFWSKSFQSNTIVTCSQCVIKSNTEAGDRSCCQINMLRSYQLASTLHMRSRHSNHLFWTIALPGISAVDQAAWLTLTVHINVEPFLKNYLVSFWKRFVATKVFSPLNANRFLYAYTEQIPPKNSTTSKRVPFTTNRTNQQHPSVVSSSMKMISSHCSWVRVTTLTSTSALPQHLKLWYTQCKNAWCVSFLFFQRLLLFGNSPKKCHIHSIIKCVSG